MHHTVRRAALCFLLTNGWILGFFTEAAPAVSGVYGLPDVLFGGEYTFEETVRMQDRPGTEDSTVGYSVRGNLLIEYLHENLILATISPLKLHIASRKAPTPTKFAEHRSQLDDMENGPFIIEIVNGKVNGIFVSKSEPISMSNLKKGIASVFQFQSISINVNETDVSGECETEYSVNSNAIFKEKNNCRWPEQRVVPATNLWGNKIWSTRKTTIKHDKNKIVESIEALEDHTTQSVLSHFAFLGVSTDLKLLVQDRQVKKEKLTLGNVDDVITRKSKELGVEFEKLAIAPQPAPLETNIMKFADVVEKFSSNLQNSELGNTKSAWALVKSIRSAKNTKAEDLYTVLSSKKFKKIRPQLIDIYGSVQTNATHQAALKFLKINTKNMDLDLCERYLWALSTSPNIKSHVVREILEMVKAGKHPNPKLWQTLILTVSAMAHKYDERCGHCDGELVEGVVQFLNESMSECPNDDDECQLIYLRGLVNIPSDAMKSTLVEKAINSKGRVGVLIMRVIERLGPDQWDDQVLRASEQIFLGNSTYDSSSRCIALDILLKSNPNDRLLYRIISLLERPFSSRELKEYLLQRLDDIAETDPEFKLKVKGIILEQGHNHYDHLAQGGLSTAFRRGFMNGGELSTTQEVVGGLLKRGNVHVSLMKGDEVDTVFTLGLFSSGLGSFMSSSEEVAEDEVTTGGLELTVLGVNLRPFVFFNGQGELMGHVWSGTASSITPAFQALLLLEDNVHKIPLQIGYYTSLTTGVGASGDLSGKIEISLWNRNAQALVQNRAGLAFDGRIDIDATYVKTTAEYNLFSEPELHLKADLEFHSGVALCLQLHQPTSSMRYNTYRIERIPGSKHKLRRSRYRTIPIPGRSYALNSKNNDMCNLLV
ncbi:transfer protein [Nesidiocoris tenuis]|uniref:Transfer protein n=1 Tax=Nesidiocoris tenuis TaxID=355587 RepID=A0ABN7AAC8_9HEMI|nr:transfer protein [Nesidiocoris tenuis]